MYDPLDVVNDARDLVGLDAIGAFGEDEPGGIGAEAIFRNEVGFALGVGTFSWASRVFLLSLLEEAAPTGHARLFRLPSERIGPPLRLTDDATDPDRIFNAFVLLGEDVASDAAALWAECKYMPSPRLWSATFRQTIVVALAGRFAYSATADRNTEADKLRQAYGSPSELFRGGLMGAAIAEDARAKPPRRIDMARNPFLDSWRS